MNGTNSITGKPLGGIDHLRQSIKDILSTPAGSRIKRRWYGSDLFKLIDAPINRDTLADIYAETAVALSRTDPNTGLPVEPRFRLTSVVASSAAPGSVELTLTGIYLPEGQEITLDGIKVI